MGSCAAPSAKGDDKFITTDYLQQCHKIPFRRRIDSSKPTCRQNRCCKNGSDHRFRFLRRPQPR
ncbi:hypothetical protein DMR34_29175 [Klebsiella variicola]|nr:hypothetical protein DMR34_29175 [Klebsiella variicola]